MAGSLLPRGRPSNEIQRQRYRLQQMVSNLTTDEEVAEVWDHVKEMAAISTDIQWATLFLAYTLGKPAPMTEPAAGIQIDGDLNIQLNQLSPDQLRALKTLNVSYDELPAPQDPDAIE